MSSSAPAPQSASSASASMSASTATAPAENVVVLDDVVAGYLPGVNILNGANLTAAKGELIGIIGPNGAGKSTMLKAIFGQVKVRSESVTLNGEDITGLRANKLVAKGVGISVDEARSWLAATPLLEAGKVVDAIVALSGLAGTPDPN